MYTKKEIEKIKRLGYSLKDINKIKKEFEEDLLERLHDLYFWKFEQSYLR
jgi:hypothetical protein